MKRIISILVCLILLALLAVPAFAAGAQFGMSASSSNLKRGDTVTFSVRISASEAYTSAGLKLSYDTSAFELVSGSCSVPGATLNSFKNGFAFGFSEATAYSGGVGSFTLRVKATAPIKSYTISGTGSNAGGCSITVKVTCDHTYYGWEPASGTQHQRTCSKCGHVDTANHGWDISDVTKQPNCKEEGQRRLGCKTCGYTKTEPIAKTDDHKLGAATKVDGTTHKQTCSVCQKEVTSNHTWNKGAVTKQPSCKEEGVKTFECTACDATKTESVAKTDKHTLGTATKIDDSKHKQTCSVCQKEVTSNHTWDKGKVTVKPTCKDEGEKTITCSGCGATKTETVKKTTEHTYKTATKVDDKKHKQTCTVCNKTETVAHTWDKGKVTKEATCKEEGEKTLTCTACKVTKTEKVPLADHKFEAYANEGGISHKNVCTVCGKEEAVNHVFDQFGYDELNHWEACICGEKQNVQPHEFGEEWASDTENHWYVCRCGAVGQQSAHLWDAGTVTKEATVQEEGINTYTCAECGATREELIEKLPVPEEPEEPVDLKLVLTLVGLGVLVACGAVMITVLIVKRKKIATDA